MKHNIKVAISNFPPLIIDQEGKYAGFEIDLWEAIAKKNKFNFEYHQKPFGEILPSLAQKKADVGLAGITINEKREKIIDFSYPTINSGLLILVNKNRHNVRIFKTAKFFLQQGYKAIISPLLLVLGFVAIFANVLWIAERSAKTFSAYYFPGIFEAAWLVICSMSTDSFGDYVPHTWAGRIITTGIIVGGVAIFGLFIAQVTALIAIKKIKGDINSYRDLGNKKVATVKHSTSILALQNVGAQVLAVETIQQACDKLKNQEVDAVVFDAPVLLSVMETKDADSFEIVGDVFARQGYGIALQPASALREKINQTLLMLRESGQYDILYKKWFGENSLMEM